MKRLVKVAMTLTLMFMVINVSHAQQGQRNGNRQGQRNGQGYGVEQGLNLTDEQQTEMKGLRLKLQQEALPLRNKLGENRARLRTLSSAETADLKAINKLIDSNSQLTGNMAKLRAANHQEVRSLLTDEQRIIFDSRGFDRGDRRTQGQRGDRHQRGAKRHGQGYGQQGKF